MDGEGVKVSGTSNSLPWPVGGQGKGDSRRRQNSTGHHLHTLPITHYHLGTPNPRRLRPFHQNNTKAFDQHRPGSTIDSSLLLSFTSPVAPARVCLTTTDLLAISLFIASVSLLCILCLVGHPSPSRRPRVNPHCRLSNLHTRQSRRSRPTESSLPFTANSRSTDES